MALSFAAASFRRSCSLKSLVSVSLSSFTLVLSDLALQYLNCLGPLLLGDVLVEGVEHIDIGIDQILLTGAVHAQNFLLLGGACVWPWVAALAVRLLQLRFALRDLAFIDATLLARLLEGGLVNRTGLNLWSNVCPLVRVSRHAVQPVAFVDPVVHVVERVDAEGGSNRLLCCPWRRHGLRSSRPLGHRPGIPGTPPEMSGERARRRLALVGP
eukprot:scaffold6757_cov25-Phaeocystis_antarctica.AAC.1